MKIDGNWPNSALDEDSKETGWSSFSFFWHEVKESLVIKHEWAFSVEKYFWPQNVPKKFKMPNIGPICFSFFCMKEKEH